MKTSYLPPLILLLLALAVSVLLGACSTSKSNFRAVQTSDGRVGVQTVTTAKDEEVMAVAIEECKKLNLDDTGKVLDLRERIKEHRIKKSVSVEDVFKNYEL